MILFIDNQDSFVHNLARYVRRLGMETRVVRSDKIGWMEAAQLRPAGVIISPGPRHPIDAGCSIDIIQHFDPAIPILGVCLGHQAIGLAMGARIIQCDPVHGMASAIQHDSAEMFAGCPNPMTVGRYHSLAIDNDGMPDDLLVTATTADGLVMGVRHRNRPVYGVQFHPESILSVDGERILANFVKRIAACHSETAP